MAIRNFTELAYSKSVKAMQQRLGTRERNAELEREARNTEVTDGLSAYLAERTSILFATAAKSGWPYVQHRGGPKGFVRTLDRHTIAFADYPGNKQYITLGNLAENPKATILAINYAERQRVKIWGEAELVEDDRDLLDSLMPPNNAIYVSRAIRFHVVAWDINCPSHIPQLFTLEEVEAASAAMLARIAELEAQLTARELA
ncbi:pyridoxamine 5'-phosphate oxidase family protein [Dongia deserti]|uniref:pyridoxamine 5'-phosphate oxidase family protein n=1 Tax=Dongia deserti TaxID=2268030 RepID=UPI000E65A7E3|nr:pyridoxamine 5'-phosphate oxidase family protein [Dongia deserti]